MPPVVRIGDSVTCGDHSAKGSNNVFANGLPISHQTQNLTTGHGCFPPTRFTTFSKSVFVNNSPVVIKGSAIIPHSCGSSAHGGSASTGSPDVFADS